MKAVVLLSGGMDSGVLCAFQKYVNPNEELHALSFDYGSKHAMRELDCAIDLAEKYCNSHRVMALDLGKLLGASSSLLKGGKPIPEGHYEDKTMMSTVVPFRNGILLSIAVGYAESIHAKYVYIASHAGDRAIYPDCRWEFNVAMSEAARLGTYAEVELLFPFQHDTKRGVALKGIPQGFDFSKTWSCYKGGKLHCGKCGTCIERQEALEGFDTTKYEEE